MDVTQSQLDHLSQLAEALRAGHDALAAASTGKRSQEPEADDDNNVPLNFRVPAEFRRRYKMLAAAHDMKLSELLQVAFNEYEKQQREA